MAFPFDANREQLAELQAIREELERLVELMKRAVETLEEIAAN